MKIYMRDGRQFQGTGLQIVQGMRAIAFGVERLSMKEYIDWVVANAKKFENVELNVSGATDDERADSLVAAMIDAGLAERVI